MRSEFFIFKEIFHRKEKFPYSFIYFFIEIFFIVIALVSCLKFKLTNTEEKKFCFIYLNTVGDALEQLHFAILKNNINYEYKILALNISPTNDYLKLILNSDRYFFYDEFFYKVFLKFINFFFKSDNNLIIRYNYIFQLILNNFLSDLKYFNKNSLFIKDIDSIKKKIKKKDKIFQTAFKKNNLFFTKIPAKIEKFELHKKTYFDFDTCENYSAIKENRILNEIGLTKNNYICLHIRTDEQSKSDIRSSYDLSSYKKAIKFLVKEKLQVVLMGNKNRKVQKFFKNTEGVYDYRNSKLQSIENDIYLTKNSNFFITQISGPIMYAVLFNKAILVWDAMNFEDFQIYEKVLYFPKKIFSKINSKQLEFNEIINNPMIYNESYFDKKFFYTEELNIKERLSALILFLKCHKKNDYKLNSTDQFEFKNKIDKHFNFVTIFNLNKIFFKK